MFIYVIVCNESLKLYVGQHKGTDLQKYLHQKISHALRHEAKGSALYNAMRAHPKESWSIWPLASGIEARAELDELERHYIRVLKAQNKSVGYNICRGGEGFTGPHTAETLQKIAEKMTDFLQDGTRSDEWRVRQGQKARERWQNNPEFREKITKNMIGNTYRLGTTQSDEFKAAVSVRFKGRVSPTKGTKRTEVQKQKTSESMKRAWADGRFAGKNITGPNNPMFGKHPSPETLSKMSANRKGKLVGEKHPMFGKHPSAETLEKMSQNRKGKNMGNKSSAGTAHTEEHKCKISESLKRAWASGRRKPKH